ncbi:MAG: type IV toxin-antitoxin system AbiEi family antitoxin domain-containing protein [Solirubrobacteraceae bacterium]
MAALLFHVMREGLRSTDKAALLSLSSLHAERELERILTSTRGLELLDRFVSEGRTAFTAAEVRDALRVSPQATSNALKRLADSGLIDRVAPGRYVARPIGALGTAAVWDDLGSAVAAVFGERPHRIGFLSALDHHGLLLRPVRAIQVASPYRPRQRALSGRPLRVVAEHESTVLLGTERLGLSRVATVERALLDVASRPRLAGGMSRLAEALAAVDRVSAVDELAGELHALAAYRRIGSIATTLALPIAGNLEPPSWRSLIELDRSARGEQGWTDTTWGVAWPYPASELEAVVFA